MKVFITITISLSIVILLVLIYLIYTLVRLKKIKFQIKLHKETTLSSKYIMGLGLPVLLELSTNAMISIDLLLFFTLCALTGTCVYLNEEYEKLSKELIHLMEDEKNGTMES